MTGGRKIMLPRSPPLSHFPHAGKNFCCEKAIGLCAPSGRKWEAVLPLCVRNPDKWCVRPENKLHMATDRPNGSISEQPWGALGGGVEYSNSGRHDVRAQKKKTPIQAKQYLVRMLIKAFVLWWTPYLTLHCLSL